MWTELLPCPFCGGEAVLQKHNVTIPGRIICKCGAEIRAYRGQRIEELISAWNTRHERTCRIDVFDNITENEGNGDVWLECSKCHWQMDYAEAPSMPLNYCPNCGARVVER